jgi:hypothetical protein
MGTNKTPPAIRDKAIHRVHGHQGGCARSNKRHRPRSNKLRKRIIGHKAYNVYTMSLYIGVESFYGKPQDS